MITFIAKNAIEVLKVIFLCSLFIYLSVIDGL